MRVAKIIIITISLTYYLFVFLVYDLKLIDCIVGCLALFSQEIVNLFL